MRPRSLDEFVGQTNVIGENTILGAALRRSGKLSSLILWGPPGTGKTTLARLIAQSNGAKFIALSAVLAGVREVRAAIDEARRERRDARTILFIDEIHRFNKSQQDALFGRGRRWHHQLDRCHHRKPFVRGQFCVTIAVPRRRSRAARARRHCYNHSPCMADSERGLAGRELRLTSDLIDKLASWTAGDARVALSTLDDAALATAPAADGTRTVTESTLVEALGRARYAYDRQGEDHYNLASALIKSVRNSDANLPCTGWRE